MAFAGEISAPTNVGNYAYFESAMAENLRSGVMERHYH